MQKILLTEALAQDDRLLLGSICKELGLTLAPYELDINNLNVFAEDSNTIILLSESPKGNLLKLKISAILEKLPVAKILLADRTFNTNSFSAAHIAGCHAVCPIPLDASVLRTQLSALLALNDKVDLEQRYLKLESAYDTTIEGWVRTLDLRDKETETHSIRVANMAVQLATKMGLSKDQIKMIRIGSLLHDIGKIAIPDAILQKRGTLTYDERAIMERHPEYAYVMLMGIDHLTGALDIPYCHHEKFDGTGYPLGLSGEEIPLSARIFSIVDVYDAFISDRPYKESIPPREAVETIATMAGTHFDPAITEHFIAMMSEVDRAAA